VWYACYVENFQFSTEVVIAKNQEMRRRRSRSAGGPRR
jgi:hypothetical protein